ncbi:MAG: Pilus assembly protein PilP [Gammaproteobacteria bacterium]|jgi:hypothetical protein|nr:Pilus assembly protein PilP [Gammaproteobacteria bacterium]
MLIRCAEEKWQELSKLKKYGLFFSWLGLLCLISFILLKPVMLKISQLQKQVAIIQANLIHLKIKQSDFLQVKEAAGKDSNILGEFSDMCAKRQVKLLSLKTAPDQLRNGVRIAPVELSLEGNYRPVLQCLEVVGHQAVIHDFDIKKTAHGMLLIHMNSSIYMGLKRGRQSLFASLDAVQDPFQSKTLPKNSINAYPFSQIHLLGTIQQNTKYYAIVADPSKHVYPVEEGSSIGLEQLKVVNIQAGTLWLKTSEGRDRVIKLTEAK